MCARTRGRIAHGLRTFFTLQTHQQKDGEDLRGWRISLHKQEGLHWKSAKNNVSADHRVVNPDWKEKRNIASEWSVCGCDVCGLEQKQALSEPEKGVAV